MQSPEIVSAQHWQSALADMLIAEKEMTRARDALAAKRRRMPWTPVDKTYRFDGPDGPATLLDLFDGRRQLIVYRAFMDPGMGDWPDHGCVGCSLMADHIGNLAHLNARDTTLVYVSRGSQADIARMKGRMGWDIPWYTMIPTGGTGARPGDFDVDFGVDQWHGTNAFIRTPGDRVYRTYFIDNRGDEVFVNTWNFLDMTALGRQETWEDSPPGYPQSAPYEWWSWHDTYGGAVQAADLYQATRARITDLLASSDAAAWASPVPACPGWSVRDVVSHMTAVAEDWATGALSGAPTDEQTAEHVRRYDHHDDAALLEVWSQAGAHLRTLAADTGLEPPLGDIACHEHDIRGAIDRPGARDARSVTWTADRLLTMLQSPVPLRVVAGDHEYRTGPPDGTELTLATTAFDALRWRTGRRSRAQLAAMDWSADPAAVLDHLCLFGPAAEDVVE